MVVVDRKFGGAAAKATLLTNMTATVPGGGGTITVSDDSGYPTTGKFEIVIDRGENNEENVLISSRSGATFTISQRGYDGSVAGQHDSGVAFVEHDLSGRTVQLFVDHVDDVEANPHSSSLPVGTTAGHDVEARHTFGAALGTPVTPTALTPDIAGNAGTGNNPSREDHAHNVPAAAPGNILPDDAAAEGAAASFARADHTHGITAAVANTIVPDASPAEGAATSFSRSDHTHGIAAATAVSIGTANAEGSSSSFARADHTHDLLADSVAQNELTLNYVAGKDTITFSSQSAIAGSDTFGVTFTASPVVATTVQIGSNLDILVNLDGEASTTGFSYRAFQKDGTAVSGTGSINWIAVGTIA